MRRTTCSIVMIFLVLALTFTSISATASAQDVQSDRYFMPVVLISGNDAEFGGNESYSNLKSMLQETGPASGLGFRLTVKDSLSSGGDLTGAKLLIIASPSSASVLNLTTIIDFLDSGGSLFMLSNYYGGGSMNSSSILNSILNESSISGVAFESDAILVSNSTPNWQERVYNNNTLAVRVNSTMFDFASSPEISVGLTSMVTLSCSLNIVNRSDPRYVGFVSAQSDSGVSDWLLLISDGVGRSVLCGSASMFNDTYLGVESNQALFRNLALWLVQNFQMSPPELFVYMVMASSAVVILGAAIYVAYSRRRTTL